MPHFPPNLEYPKIEESQISGEGFLKVQVDKLRWEDGTSYEYSTALLSPSSVMVLALTPDQNFVINREYRHPTGKYLLGCPGGLVEEGEEVLQAAKRELLEETGYTASDFTPLGSAYSFPGVSSQKAYYLLATGAQKTQEPTLETSEVIHPTLMSLQELQQAALASDELDGLLATALFFYKLHLRP